MTPAQSEPCVNAFRLGNLARVIFWHDYFFECRPRGWAIHPDQETRRFMDREGMILARTEQGMDLFIDECKISNFLDGLGTRELGGVLHFAIRTSDPDWAYYTDTDVSPKLQALDPVTNRQTPLSGAAAFPDKSDLHGTIATIALPIPPRIDGQADAPGIEAPLVYQLTFRTKTLPWKYVLLGNWPESPLRILDSRAKIEFSPPGSETLANGRQAIVFNSLSDIELREVSLQRFQLRSGEPAEEQILVPRLPNAAPQCMWRGSIEHQTKSMFEIFVNR